jgi:hypothetical protein
MPPDLLEEVAAEAQELPVVEGRVHGRDQVPALPEDRDPERFGRGRVREIVVSVRHHPS